MPYHGKYKTPTELLEDGTLSRDQKIEMLKKWRDDEKDLIRAASEGMTGGETPNMLKQVKKALLSLDAVSPET